MNKDNNILTPESLNTELIAAIRKKIPEGSNLANILADLLSIGKEAIYRRFRGEVAFTFSEAVTISKQLGISLDNILGISMSGENRFELNHENSVDPQEVYLSKVDFYQKLFSNIISEPNAQLWDASNRVPTIMFMQYPTLAKFHIFKWLYQRGMIHMSNPAHSFESITYDQRIFDSQANLLQTMQKFVKHNYVWDNEVFGSIISDLRFFRNTELISDEAIKSIQGELYNIVDKLQMIATKGENEKGYPVDLYFSNIKIDSSYAYIETELQKMSIIKVYDLNTITSRDERVFESLRSWVQSLLKFSVLISKSAELVRYKYFKTQKESIDSILPK